MLNMCIFEDGHYGCIAKMSIEIKSGMEHNLWHAGGTKTYNMMLFSVGIF